MEIDVKKTGDSEVEILATLPAEEFDKCRKEAISNLGKDVEVEGFRKGNAPEEIIEGKVGRERILSEASDLCVRENYPKAISESKIEPLGQPQIEVVKVAAGNPFQFKVKVAIPPQVKLPDYKKIALEVETKEVEVTQEEINRLKEQKEKTEKDRLRGEILDKISQQTEVEVPRSLVEAEKSRMIEDVKNQVAQTLKISFEDYLKKIGKTEEDFASSFSSEAEKRLKNTFTLREIEKAEKPEVAEEEISQEMAKIYKSYPNLDQKRAREYAEEVAKNEKILQLLEDLSTKK